ncbi:4Fe-4S binding protein [Methanobrevibacter woesei]|uniref:4Fe-4S binding protein n=1 Tax=Methanobrevibacter woesei TaxID=190976 RepID=UPI00388DBFAF
MRHRRGSSSIGLEIGKLIFSELLNVKYKSRWRIGNNINQCNLCGKCELICSSNAIKVSRPNKTWTLNNMRCNQCLRCVMSCPVRCLKQAPIIIF